MSGRTAILGGAAVVAAGVVIALVLAASGGGGRGPTATSSTVPLAPPVAVAGERDEVLALIRNAQGLTYHARYEATAGAPESFPRTVEVWRRAGASRTDTAYEAAGASERSASIRTAAGVVSCRKAGAQPWACETADADADTLFDQAAADLAGADVSARDAEVRGRAGRCFTVEGDESLELCFDADGVLLRLAVGGGALELVDRDATVDAAALEPPAQV